jgi:hypothetical protein
LDRLRSNCGCETVECGELIGGKKRKLSGF